MRRALAVLALASALGGCVTGIGVWKRERTTLPMLIGAAAATLVVTTAIASQAADVSTGGSIAAGVAVTAVDVGIGCLFGACKSLPL
jgi:hypothetical protein